MPPSTSSRESSPLSAASDEAPENSNPQYPPGSMMRPTRESRSRSARSPTTSTAPADVDSVLSSLSDDEADVDESGQATAQAGSSPTASQTQEHDDDIRRPRSNSDLTDYGTPSPGPENKTNLNEEGQPISRTEYMYLYENGSLSPAPPSAESKPTALPTAQENNVSELDGAIQEESDDSDLESLTDSNAGDKPDVDEAEEQETDGIKENGSDLEDDLEDEDEEGDVTMKADSSNLADILPELEEGSAPGKEETELPEGEAVAESAVEEEEAGAERQAAHKETEAENEDTEEAPDSPALTIQPFRPHSSHPPPPNSAAVKALLGLEIKFAALRDQLYVERMEETAAEEEMILNGSHPAVSYLFRNLKARRERLHEVASRKHKQVLHELAKVKDESKEHVWTWWTDERDREQWDEFEETWAKRRRLIREKSELDNMPNKRQRPIPRTRADVPKPLDWAAGAIPAPMSSSEAASDLGMMDPRRNMSNHASPAVFQSYNVQGGPSYNPHAYRANPAEELTYQQQPQQPQQPQHHIQYAQRVPVPAPVMHQQPQQPQTQHSAPISRPLEPIHGNGNGNGNGNPYQTTATARIGRTVPTSSSLFDGGRRSNEGPGSQTQPQGQQQPQSQVPPLPQAPPPRPTTFGHDLWGNHRRELATGTSSSGLGLSNGTNGNGNDNGNGNGHSYNNPNGPGYNPFAQLAQIYNKPAQNISQSQSQSQNGINTHTTLNTASATVEGQKISSPTTATSAPSPVVATVSGENRASPVPTSITTTSAPAQAQAASSRYTGLSYLTASNVNAALSPQQSQSQKLGALSSPKSTLGISGVPTALPFA